MQTESIPNTTAKREKPGRKFLKVMLLAASIGASVLAIVKIYPEYSALRADNDTPGDTMAEVLRLRRQIIEHNQAIDDNFDKAIELALTSDGLSNNGKFDEAEQLRTQAKQLLEQSSAIRDLVVCKNAVLAGEKKLEECTGSAGK